MDSIPAFDPGMEAPPPDCGLCPRLSACRAVRRAANPEWFNAPVASCGPAGARLLIVGMAPGTDAGNRTGRILADDDDGALLVDTLRRLGLAQDDDDAQGGVRLVDTRMTNAMRCAPPANLPHPSEVSACNRFLRAELHALGSLRAVLALGVLAHAAVLKACGVPSTRIRFRHGEIHTLPDGLLLADSHHLSRFNAHTGRLPAEMFASVVLALLQRLATDHPAPP